MESKAKNSVELLKVCNEADINGLVHGTPGKQSLLFSTPAQTNTRLRWHNCICYTNQLPRNRFLFQYTLRWIFVTA